MTKRVTTEEFIERAKKVHGDRYDYSNVIYVGANKKVDIICHEHGSYLQTPSKHLSGNSCRKCGQPQKMSTNEFAERAEKIHHGRYG